MNDYEYEEYELNKLNINTHPIHTCNMSYFTSLSPPLLLIIIDLRWISATLYMLSAVH